MQLSYVILYVNDIQSSIDFYQNAFGLKHKFTHESKMYAEMDTGQTCLAFCNHQLANQILKQSYKKASPQTEALGCQISLCPEDVTKAYKTAIDNGALSVCPPEIKPWNFEVAIVRDCDGHIIELAKNLNL